MLVRITAKTYLTLGQIKNISIARHFSHGILPPRVPTSRLCAPGRPRRCLNPGLPARSPAQGGALQAAEDAAGGAPTAGQDGPAGGPERGPHLRLQHHRLQHLHLHLGAGQAGRLQEPGEWPG